MAFFILTPSHSCQLGGHTSKGSTKFDRFFTAYPTRTITYTTAVAKIGATKGNECPRPCNFHVQTKNDERAFDQNAVKINLDQ